MLETRRLIDSVSASARIQTLFTGGGFTGGPACQLLADILGREIVVSTAAEASLLGAAVLGWAGLEDGGNIGPAVARMVKSSQRSVKPGPIGAYDRLFARYKMRVEEVRNLYAERT
jgi:sugar (pentulose or hexulose) kinase